LDGSTFLGQAVQFDFGQMPKRRVSNVVGEARRFHNIGVHPVLRGKQLMTLD
jgi:hypothetical protein